MHRKKGHCVVPFCQCCGLSAETVHDVRMDAEAFFHTHKRLSFSEEDVQVEALGNPLQNALSLAAYYSAQDEVQPHSVEFQGEKSNSQIGRAAGKTPLEAPLPLTHGGLLQAKTGTLSSIGLKICNDQDEERKAKVYDSSMREHSIEKRYTSGEGDIFSEDSFVDFESCCSSTSSSSSTTFCSTPPVTNTNSSTRQTTCSALSTCETLQQPQQHQGGEEQQQQGDEGNPQEEQQEHEDHQHEEQQQQLQETPCEEDVSAEEEVEVVDVDSTATEGEGDGGSQFYSSEDSADERGDQGIDDEENERYDVAEESNRSVAFCDAFAGLGGEGVSNRLIRKRGIEQQLQAEAQQQQQLHAPGKTYTAAAIAAGGGGGRAAVAGAATAATPTRGKRKLPCVAWGEESDTERLMTSQEKRGKKAEEEKEDDDYIGFHFESEGKTGDHVVKGESTERKTHSSRRAKRSLAEPDHKNHLDEVHSSPNAWPSPTTFTGSGYLRCGNNCSSSNTRDPGRSSGSRSASGTTDKLSLGRNSSSSSRRADLHGSSSTDHSSAGKRRNSSRSFGGDRQRLIKLRRRRVSEAETCTAHTGNGTSGATDTTNKEGSHSYVGLPATKAHHQAVEAAEAADPLARLTRRTEHLLQMHSRRFVEERQKC